MDQPDNRQLTKLVQAAARGDRRAFRDLYDLTSAVLLAVAMSVLRDRDLAEDVLQDAFVKVWHRAGDYHADRGNVMTWLIAIVRYRAIDVLRKRRPLSMGGGPEFDDDLADTIAIDLQADNNAPGPLSSAIRSDDSESLQQCIERLSQSQIQSVSLAFFRGLTHQEISDTLSLPLGTIKSRLRRSLQRLKECLAEFGYMNEIPTRTD